MFAKEAQRFDKMELRVHEAGHALARVVVAATMDWPRDKIVGHIEYGMPDGLDEKRICFSNSTHGLILSNEMEAVLETPRTAKFQWEPVTEAEAVGMFDRFRCCGCDLKSWMFARYMIALGGVVAEAKFLNRNVWDIVIEQFDDANDFASLMRDLSFLRRRYASETMLRLSTDYLKWVFSQPDVWKTIIAVAKSLKLSEITPGAEIMHVIDQNMRKVELFDFNNLPQARIRRDPTWNSIATCFLMDLDDWRFSSVSGGRQVRTEKEFLYAKLCCSEVLDGSVGHSCMHGDGPHEIWVCVLPTDNKESWSEITTEAAWGLHHAA